MVIAAWVLISLTTAFATYVTVVNFMDRRWDLFAGTTAILTTWIVLLIVAVASLS